MADSGGVTLAAGGREVVLTHPDKVYRIRVNLEHVPPEQRPRQEELIADYGPWEGYSGHQR